MAAVVSIVLTSASEEVPQGATGVVSIRVTNVSDREILIVGIVDGSESGARYPRWIPIVRGLSVMSVERPDFVAPLTPADFRRLAPGESFDPAAPEGGAHFFPLAAFDALTEMPGRYSIALELDTSGMNADDVRGTLPDRRPEAGRDAEKVLTLLESVPRLRVMSNTVGIAVR